MRRQMEEMDMLMGSMIDPFGQMMGRPSHSRNPRELMIDDSRVDQQRQSGRRQNRPSEALMPFGMGLLGGGLFGGINDMFAQMVTQIFYYRPDH